jgi:uncharacterized protein YgiM (DUF1202 family)
MRRLLARILACAAGLLLAISASAQPTTLTVHHNANLRQNHSTQSAIKAQLVPGDELTTIDPTKTAGFWHVRTADGTEGWVEFPGFSGDPFEAACESLRIAQD